MVGFNQADHIDIDASSRIFCAGVSKSMASQNHNSNGACYILIDPYRSPFCMMSSWIWKTRFEIFFSSLGQCAATQSACRQTGGTGLQISLRAQALYTGVHCQAQRTFVNQRKMRHKIVIGVDIFFFLISAFTAFSCFRCGKCRLSWV